MTFYPDPSDFLMLLRAKAGNLMINRRRRRSMSQSQIPDQDPNVIPFQSLFVGKGGQIYDNLDNGSQVES